MEYPFCCGGSGGLAPQAFRCESIPTPLNLTYILPYDCPCFARMRNSFSSVDLSTVDLSTCNMAIYAIIWSLHSVAGVWGACTQAFCCESMPTPLNLTYILPYDCACFARMRNSFTSVNLSTVYLLTCLPVGLSTCRPVNILLAIACVQYTSDVLSALIIVYDLSFPQALRNTHILCVSVSYVIVY